MYKCKKDIYSKIKKIYTDLNGYIYNFVYFFQINL